jgi:hypothetical protein
MRAREDKKEGRGAIGYIDRRKGRAEEGDKWADSER